MSKLSKLVKQRNHLNERIKVEHTKQSIKNLKKARAAKRKKSRKKR